MNSTHSHTAILLTLKRSQWQDAYDGHAVPERCGHPLIHLLARSVCSGLDHWLDTNFYLQRTPSLCRSWVRPDDPKTRVRGVVERMCDTIEVHQDSKSTYWPTQMSRIWRNRLSVATGAALTLVTLWLFLLSAAPVVVLHA